MKSTRVGWRRLAERLAVPFAFSALALVVVSFGAAAPPSHGGELDASFGSAGLVTSDLTGDADSACCVALQQDGKIVVAGAEASRDGSAGIAFVARYLPNGSLDSSFGGSGVVLPRFSAGDDLVQALAIQTDGKIVAAGSVVAPDTNIVLARLNPDGSLDTGFGAGGKVVTGFGPGSRERALAVEMASDGKIVVSGAARGGGLPPGNFVVARYNPNGTLDTTFGSGGKTITDFGALGEAHGLAIDASGKIIAVGGTFSISSAGAFWGKAFLAARYNPDGSPDTSFGSGGKVATDFGSEPYGALAADVVVQRDGKIVSVGSVGLGNARATVVRYNADGSLDTSFGDGGKLVLDEPAEGSDFAAVAQDSRGRTLAAGTAGGPSLDFELVRLTPNGALDKGFGAGGMVRTNFGGSSSDVAGGLALQQDGKMVLVGASDAKSALARYLPTYCLVPNVKGKPLAAAKRVILSSHCTVGKVRKIRSRTVRPGHVVSQIPRRETQRPEDAAVALAVSRGR